MVTIVLVHDPDHVRPERRPGISSPSGDGRIVAAYPSISHPAHVAGSFLKLA